MWGNAVGKATRIQKQQKSSFIRSEVEIPESPWKTRKKGLKVLKKTYFIDCAQQKNIPDDFVSLETQGIYHLLKQR